MGRGQRAQSFNVEEEEETYKSDEFLINVKYLKNKK
jgi:hypothetical protein